MDLYKILGIKRNASPEEIKKAYKRTAKKTHPDKGGSDEEFQETNKAYEVLSNTKLRKHYDEHGTIDENDGPDKHSAMKDVAQIFEMVITKNEERIDYVNIITEMLSVFDQGKKSTKKSILESKKKIPYYEKIASRIATDDEKENIFESFIGGKISDLNHTIASAEEQLNRIEESIAIVEIYSCTVELQEEPDYSSFGRRANDRRNQFRWSEDNQ